MIIVGLGKESKKIAYLGVLKCANCRNHTHFSLYEVANKLKLYFISVANISKKYYSVCDICNAGNEISSEKKQKILINCAKIPDKATFIKVKVILDETVKNMFIHTGQFSDELFYEAVGELKKSFPEKQVDYIVQNYLNWFFDEDTPK